MQRSDSAEHSLAAAKFALQSVRSQGFRVKESVPECDFASRPATKDNLRLLESPLATSSLLVPTTTSNESHTRSYELRARSRIRNPTSLTLVPTRGKRTQQRSATMFAVFLLCVLRATFVHARTRQWASVHAWMSGRAYESSLSMSRPVYRLKTTNAVLWQCGDGQAQTLLTDEEAYFHRALLALCQFSRTLALLGVSVHITFKQFVRVFRDPRPAVVARPKPDMFADLAHEPKTIWTDNNYKSN